MKNSVDDLLLTVECKDSWSEYVEANVEIIDHLIEITGSELRALMFLTLRTQGLIHNLEVFEEEDD